MSLDAVAERSENLTKGSILSDAHGPGRRFSELLSVLYSVVDEPGNWGVFQQHHLCKELNAIQSSLALAYPDCPLWSRVSIYGWTPEDYQLWQEEWRDRDLWRLNLYRINPRDGLVGRSSELISDEEFTASEFYKEFCGPRGWHCGAGAIIYANERQQVVLTITRPYSTGHFTEEELDLLRELMPHMQRVVRVLDERQRAEAERDAMRALLETGRLGLLLLNQNGAIIQANERAEDLLSQEGPLRRVDGRLRTADSTLARQLVDLLR